MTRASEKHIHSNYYRRNCHATVGYPVEQASTSKIKMESGTIKARHISSRVVNLYPDWTQFCCKAFSDEPGSSECKRNVWKIATSTELATDEKFVHEFQLQRQRHVCVAWDTHLRQGSPVVLQFRLPPTWNRKFLHFPHHLVHSFFLSFVQLAHTFGNKEQEGRTLRCALPRQPSPGRQHMPCPVRLGCVHCGQTPHPCTG